SSMNPTIVTRGGKLFMAVGAPGGSRITTGVLQVILDVIDFHMNPQDAVDLPRFHHQWKPDVLYLENGFHPETIAALKKMGYEIKPIESVARVEAIVVKNGVLEGGTETRLDGKVAATDTCHATSPFDSPVRKSPADGRVARSHSSRWIPLCGNFLRPAAHRLSR